MRKEKKIRGKPIPVGKILSFSLGLILLLILFYNNRIIVSDTYGVAGSSRPVSLVCRFQDLRFSEQVTVSNITKEELILLTVQMGDGEIEQYIIPTNEFEIGEIEEVGLLSWRNEEMLGILPSITTNGSYTIDCGYMIWVGRLGVQERTWVLVVEDFHPLTGIEQAILQHPNIASTILLLLLTPAICLLLVPLFEIVREG